MTRVFRTTAPGSLPFASENPNEQQEAMRRGATPVTGT
jgi:hypothetical protein